MRISDWSSDVCSSDLLSLPYRPQPGSRYLASSDCGKLGRRNTLTRSSRSYCGRWSSNGRARKAEGASSRACRTARARAAGFRDRSEEHTSELQSLMRISYAVFCLKKNIKTTTIKYNDTLQNQVK